MSVLEVKTLRKESYKGKQSEEYDELLKIEKGNISKTFRIHIDADSYQFQSSAKIEVYVPEKDEWNILSFVPYQKMYSYQYEHEFKGNADKRVVAEFSEKCRQLFGSRLHKYHECAFRLDRDRLVNDAKKIVFGVFE